MLVHLQGIRPKNPIALSFLFFWVATFWQAGEGVICRGRGKHIATRLLHFMANCCLCAWKMVLMLMMNHFQPCGQPCIRRGEGGGLKGGGGGGFGWDAPPPRVPLWSPPKAGQKFYA